MSLLDCICCWKHQFRTAACWDNPEDSSPRFLTYSCLMERAREIFNALKKDFIPQSTPLPPSFEAWPTPPVAIYGRSCPEVLCAVLGVMASSTPYLPVDLSQPSARIWSTLHACDIHTVLIELSLFNVSTVGNHLSSCVTLSGHFAVNLPLAIPNFFSAFGHSQFFSAFGHSQFFWCRTGRNSLHD